MNNRLKILNIWVDPIHRDEAIQRVKQYLSTGTRPHSVLASNPEKNFSAPKDKVLYDTFKNADLLLPDGIGIVLAARILHGADLERIPGSEFIFNICEIAAAKGYGVFIYGAKEAVSKSTVEKLKTMYPSLNIAGRSNGYVSQADMPALIDRINASKAEILFIALGSPNQEKWYARYKEQLKHVRVVQGVGGTLDTIGGTVRRAPVIWRKLSAEWLYRLIKEPKRIRRQKVLPLFAALILFSKMNSMFKRGHGKDHN